MIWDWAQFFNRLWKTIIQYADVNLYFCLVVPVIKVPCVCLHAENNPPIGEEVYVRLSKVMDTKIIVGVQKVRELWRLYIDSDKARIALISEGVVLRVVITNMYDKTHTWIKMKMQWR